VTQPLLQRLGPDEKLISACALGTVVLSFLPWWTMEAFTKTSLNAFDATWGVIAFLFAVATAVVVVGVKADVLKLSASAALRAPLLTAGASALSILIFVFAGPGKDYGQAEELGDAMGLDAGKTLWPWVALGAMAVATAVAYQRFAKATRSAGTSAPPPQA
jgi:hypothetical protein